MNECPVGYIYQTERIRVRGLLPCDLDGNYPHWFNDLEVCRYNAHGVYPATRAEMENFIHSLTGDRSRIVWAVIEQSSNTHIGNVSLQNINWIYRSAEFAVIMGEKQYWGKGYASEAANLLLTHGFKKLNLHRIYCGTALTNRGMCKLAESLKMTREGVRRQALFLNGAYVDLVEYGVLRDEFFAA